MTLRLRGLVLGLLCAVAGIRSVAQSEVDALRRGLLNPPAVARPMVRWWWFGPAVTKPEIGRELVQMKADGIGGAELAFVYPLQLEINLPFVSPAMLDMVHFAESEGRRLGLRIDVTLCSGWPYGGPHIPPGLAARRLRTYEVAVPAGVTSIQFPQDDHPDLEELISISLVDGEPGHWNAGTEQAVPAPAAEKATYVSVASADHARVALFFFDGHTRQMVKRAAAGAEGFVLDPFSHEAVATHLKAVGEPLLSAFGTTPPYAIFSDSLEAYGADWTPNLPAEFARRRGYDLLAHLPELVSGASPAAAKVRHDYGVTLTELVNENYLNQINDWAKAHGTRFRSQTYGEPAVDFSSQRLVALPEGEGPQWRAFSTLRWASSANHVFGNNVTSGETYTWLHSPVFRATPLDMKAEADIDFVMGENQLIFHGWPYSPPESELPTGDPGWSLYAAAVFNDHNPWHPVMLAVTKYITRVSYMLRQGRPANQVALLLPTDDAWSGFSPTKVTVTGAFSKLITRELMDAILAAGYNVDFIDAKAIDQVGLGSHQIVILPPTDRIPPQTVAKLAAWARGGGTVVTVGRKPSLDPEGQPLASPWDTAMPKALHVANTASLGAALHATVVPDFRFKQAGSAVGDARRHLGFIRRKLTDGDVYFVANTSNQPMHFNGSFTTAAKSGTLMDPASDSEKGRPIPAKDIELWLAPYESRVLLFDKHGTQVPDGRAPTLPKPSVALSNDWKLTFVGLKKTVQQEQLSDWISDPATMHYSGEVIYTHTLMVDSASLAKKKRLLLSLDGGAPEPGDPGEAWEADTRTALGPDGLPNPLVTGTGPGMHAYYNPPLHEAARVIVNGKDVGTLWHPPYRLDITPTLHAGENTIEIHVYNTALNAWSVNPPRDYTALKAKYGDRFQMQDLNKVKPIPSGIIGNISLLVEDGK